MAGLIRDTDIAAVRERAPIDEVIRDHVTLRNAGGGSLKGLCPFHDEKTPSFHVTPSRGYYHCFGCQEGGDVITFVQKMEGVGFTEAVERLASRFGVELHYEEGRPGAARDLGQRGRLIEANRLAAEFFRAALGSADAEPGRRFLLERGFDEAAASRFGVGFAPRSGDALLGLLRSKGVREDDAVTAGLVVRGSRGYYDRFRGRLLWPIRELSGDVVGFGARRLFEDDRVDAKYLNTPETPLYKKSHLLYGVDLARRDIASTSQAVVVEGYTDVMACHLAGVTTAVATCGTAFGEDHIRVLRRLMLDHDEFRGEVIFTFDGDEAGQQAALRAFAGDQEFVAQTYVSVEADGRDPCELRLADGDAAVRELIANRVPLYRFVLRNVVGRYDLDRADGRVDAVREAARLVASVRDRSKVEAFARELAGMAGVDVEDVRAAVRSAQRPGARGRRPGSSAEPDARPGQPEPTRVPDPGERRFEVERGVLKLALQEPDSVGPWWPELDGEDFTHPYYRAVFAALTGLGGPTASSSAAVDAALAGGDARRVVSALAVEPLHLATAPDERVGRAYVMRLRELTAMRRIAELKSRLQRMNPITEATGYNRLFGQLVALESERRTLRESVIGD
ncbi:MAG TPA: DNA primase [Nocardioidaceae bacterium]|nr:DNA primase [Nocardioidaceae bacterium]